MAGKRQHILPRFLQRGFASRTDGHKTFVWVYRKSGQCFETTVENVGLEKQFYVDGELNADEVITKLEGGYSSVVASLRELQDGTEVNDPKIPEFIAHLTIRTKQLREFFRTSTEYLLGEVTDYLAEPQNLRRMLLSKPDLIEEELEKRLEGYQIPKQQKKYLIEITKTLAPQIVNDRMSELQDTLAEMVGDIRSVLPNAVREGHIKSLAKNAAPETRWQTYQDLRWFVRDSPISLILGDFACLFEISAQRRFKPMDDMGDPIVNVFLPLGSHKMLVGTRYSSAAHVHFDVVNKAAAKCSHEYFVASESSDANEKFASTIGDWADLLTQEETDNLVHEIIADVERAPFGRSKED